MGLCLGTSGPRESSVLPLNQNGSMTAVEWAEIRSITVYGVQTNARAMKWVPIECILTTDGEDAKRRLIYMLDHPPTEDLYFPTSLHYQLSSEAVPLTDDIIAYLQRQKLKPAHTLERVVDAYLSATELLSVKSLSLF